MKRTLLLCAAACIFITGFAQTDTTGKQAPATQSDTIKIGGMIIIRKPGNNNGPMARIHISNHNHRKPSNISTNWWIVDLGFANFNDKTNYAMAQSSGFVSNQVGKDQLDLRTGKSVNVNIWFFMQRLNLIEHAVNLKYGLGLELNNYRFDDVMVRFQKNPTYISIDNSLANAKKNKLAADYITVPLMMNFNFSPRQKKSFGFSAGVSAGYLYSSRQKIKIGGSKEKLHGNFDLERWKLAYISELNLGVVKLYGSYAIHNMWSKGLDQTPYAVGLRFSNW
jgi:hypothetical protein